MKSKTIKKVLNNKINDWIDSIDDKNVKKAAENSVIITGGAIASMLLNEEVNDYDVYFSNKEDAVKIANYYINKLSDVEDIELGFPEGFKHQSDHEVDESDRVSVNVKGGIAKIVKDWDTDSKYNPIFVSNNAITLEGDIQLIFRFIGDADKIHENYDFVHCTNYWVRDGNHLELRPQALECLLTKELRYIGSKYPICSVFRTRKYINRGFTISAGEYLKICWQISKLDLSDINVLREQLVGVDIHYFNIVLNALLKKKEKDKDFEITEEYIFKLIDKVFN